MNAIRHLRHLDWRCDVCLVRAATRELLDEGYLRVAQVCDTCLEALIARYTANGFTIVDTVPGKDPAWNTTSTMP